MLNNSLDAYYFVRLLVALVILAGSLFLFNYGNKPIGKTRKSFGYGFLLFSFLLILPTNRASLNSAFGPIAFIVALEFGIYLRFIKSVISSKFRIAARAVCYIIVAISLMIYVMNSSIAALLLSLACLTSLIIIKIGDKKLNPPIKTRELKLVDDIGIKPKDIVVIQGYGECVYEGIYKNKHAFYPKNTENLIDSPYLVRDVEPYLLLSIDELSAIKIDD